jgi:hypothetical protein
MTNVDTSFEQEVFDVLKRQRKPHIHEHDQPNHFRERIATPKGAGRRAYRAPDHPYPATQAEVHYV